VGGHRRLTRTQVLMKVLNRRATQNPIPNVTTRMKKQRARSSRGLDQMMAAARLPGRAAMARM
jgi:hypothetical protein